MCYGAAMSQSIIVSLLADRPREELQRLEEEARAAQRRISVELEQIEAARALQTRREGSAGSRGRRGKTRQLVLQAVGASSGPSSPAGIIAHIFATAEKAPSKGAIRNMIGRLTEEGDLVRKGEGEYELSPAVEVGFSLPPNGSEPRGEDREGTGLLMATG
jgi:hypothetical protein